MHDSWFALVGLGISLRDIGYTLYLVLFYRSFPGTVPPDTQNMMYMILGHSDPDKNPLQYKVAV